MYGVALGLKWKQSYLNLLFSIEKKENWFSGGGFEGNLSRYSKVSIPEW